MSTEARRAPSSEADDSGSASTGTTESGVVRERAEAERSVFTPRPRAERKPTATVPAPDAPASPPPPPASARFPDAPPGANRVGERAPSRPAERAGGQARPAARAAAPTAPATPTASAAPTAPASPPPVASPRPAASPPPVRQPVAPAETPEETTTRLRPVPPAPKVREVSTPVFGNGVAAAARAQAAPTAPAAPAPPAFTAPDSRTAWSPTAPAPSPDPAYSWTAGAPTWSLGTFGEPEPFDGTKTSGAMSWMRGRVVGAAVCVVLGLGLIGGAAVGSWLTGEESVPAPASAYEAAGGLWHSVPVDTLFPPTLDGKGAGPGGADRTWTRVAVAPDSGCADAFDPLLRKALAPVGCRRLLRATYTDATQSYVTTVGLLFTKADPAAMTSLANRFRGEHLDRRTDLLPRPYAAKGTAAAEFGDPQRASWTIDVLTDAPAIAFAVSGWADGRTVDAPQPAADAVRAGATTAPAQAGLGNEAQGLADRVERRLRQKVGPATEKPA
ncbi:hypothetical protein [Streptomyces sp. NPDC005435]|uniref:hypothetical protein n=1 Tax=Streptomyces sp. NPDC005435 TaxID=3154464 RepID=UPI003455C22D